MPTKWSFLGTLGNCVSKIRFCSSFLVIVPVFMYLDWISNRFIGNVKGQILRIYIPIGCTCNDNLAKYLNTGQEM